jgi:hypothetical protein
MSNRKTEHCKRKNKKFPAHIELKNISSLFSRVPSNHGKHDVSDALVHTFEFYFARTSFLSIRDSRTFSSNSFHNVIAVIIVNQIELKALQYIDHTIVTENTMETTTAPHLTCL